MTGRGAEKTVFGARLDYWIAFSLVLTILAVYGPGVGVHLPQLHGVDLAR